jgi:hypothetical protein
LTLATSQWCICAISYRPHAVAHFDTSQASILLAQSSHVVPPFSPHDVRHERSLSGQAHVHVTTGPHGPEKFPVLYPEP